jgi:hypothetical protein
MWGVGTRYTYQTSGLRPAVSFFCQMKEKLGMKSFSEGCQGFGFGPLIEALIH